MSSWFRPALEAFERRDLPSSVNLTGGVLTVVGTNGPDAISVSTASGVVSVYDSGVRIAQTAQTNVAKIVVDAGFGNDTVTINKGVKVGAVLFGGYGDDLLRGGSGNDDLYGGAGADRLFGRGGQDRLFGGSGTDSLNGGGGTNNLVGGAPNRTRSLTATELEVVALVNLERTSRGLAPLTINSRLSYAAGFHSTQMANRSNASPNDPFSAMQHTLYGVDAPTPASRLDHAGYDNWLTYGENIAFGYVTAASVVQAWMNSPGHRANILDANFKEIGVGLVTDATGYQYWTQVFGAR
jgi:uncharacterized protein YkwD